MNNNKKPWGYYDYWAIDLFSLVFSYLLAYFIRHGNLLLFSNSLYREMLLVLIVSEFILVFLYEPFNKTNINGYFKEFTNTLIFDLLNLFIAVFYLFIIKSGNMFSRITLILIYVFYFAISYVTRIIWKKHLYKKSVNSTKKGQKSLFIVCKENEVEKSIESIENNNYDFFEINGICVIDKDLINKKYKDYKIVANKNTVLNYISTNWVDDILISTNYKNIPPLVFKGFIDSNIPLHIKIDDIDILKGKSNKLDTIGNMNVISTINNSYSNFQRFCKRAIDIIGSLFGCIITLILIIVIGPIIYIKSPGNIFYVSDRVGKNGKVFKFYKFRSMALDADNQKEKLQKSNRVKDGLMFKLDNDPRIIPGIGQFIRKTSLDEFPQFFNVLKNDMSIVGTRPPTIDEWKKYSPYYRSRLSIKPGITGLWQVSGRSNITDFDEVVRLDNEYINNWSLKLDLIIIIKTIKVAFNKEGSM